jgi:hypothetical protein
MQGDDYQALFFWLQACRLLQEHTKVEKVAYELNNIKSLDDVAVFYSEPIADEIGNFVRADYYQVKFHVSQSGSFTWNAIMEPAFINATSVSILQRLQAAQIQFAPNGLGCRFNLVAPWQVDPNDELAKLISNTGGGIRLNKLFSGGKNSKMGKVRAAWRDHLGLAHEDELRVVLQPLRILANSDIFNLLSDKLNDKLQLTGLKPVDQSSITHPYVDLIHNLLKRGHTEFTKEDLILWCQRENFWIGTNNPSSLAIPIGLRSFYRRAENMEDETKNMLCLLKNFEGRFLKENRSWHDIYLEIESFFSSTTKSSNSYHLHLDVHSSIAFAAGYCLDSKAGVDVAPVQRFKGCIVWQPNYSVNPNDYADWAYSDSIVDNSKSDVVLCIGIRHDVTADVEIYINDAKLPIRRIISCCVGLSPSALAIKDGTHAWVLAERIAAKLKQRTREERIGHLHIFFSGPNAMMFFLGQLARGFGPCTVYEYDFERQTPGAYQSALSFPK